MKGAEGDGRADAARQTRGAGESGWGSKQALRPHGRCSGTLWCSWRGGGSARGVTSPLATVRCSEATAPSPLVSERDPPA